MFVTGLTYHNIIDREPAIADYIPDYVTTLQTRIDEAKAVIDNRLRAMGYDLNLIGKKTDLWDWDNEAGASLTKAITTPDSTQNLLVICAAENETVNIAITGSAGQTIFSESSVSLSGTAIARVLPYIDGTSITVVLSLSTGSFTASTVKAYLTDPAIYFLHLYKSLQLIYGSMRSAPGDLFEMQMNYYSDLYENEFNSLVTYYDRNGNGVIEQGETQHLKRTRILR